MRMGGDQRGIEGVDLGLGSGLRRLGVCVWVEI